MAPSLNLRLLCICIVGIRIMARASVDECQILDSHGEDTASNASTLPLLPPESVDPFPPVAVQHNVGAEDDDDSGDNDDFDKRSTTSTATERKPQLRDIPIEWPPGHKSFPTCFLCQHKANEPSPLTTGYGGPYRPWLQYSKSIIDGKLTKQPKGQQCLICMNAYRAIGYDVEYGVNKKGFQVYKAAIAKIEGAKVQKTLIEATRSWIQKHNDSHSVEGNTYDQQRYRMKDRNQLKEQAHRSLEVEKKTGTNLRAPDTEFVEVSAWDEKIDGKFDASKVVEREIFGVKTKGIYKMVGRKGVYKCNEFQESSTVDTTMVQSGSDELNETACEIKSKRFSDIMKARRKEMSEKGVEAEDEMHKLMSLVQDLQSTARIDEQPSHSIGHNSQGAGESQVDDETMDGDGGSDVDKLSSDEDEDEEDPCGMSVLGSLFTLSSAAPPKAPAANPNAKAKPKPKAAKSCKSVGEKRNSNGNGNAGEPPAKAAKVDAASVCSDQHGQDSQQSGRKGKGDEPSAKKPKVADFRMDKVDRVDGRHLRILQSADAMKKQNEKILNELKFDEDHEGIFMIGDYQEQFSESLKKKGLMLADAGRETKAFIKRMESSSSKDNLADHIKEMTSLHSNIETLQKFVGLMQKPIKDLDEMTQTAEAHLIFNMKYYNYLFNFIYCII